MNTGCCEVHFLHLHSPGSLLQGTILCTVTVGLPLFLTKITPPRYAYRPIVQRILDSCKWAINTDHHSIEPENEADWGDRKEGGGGIRKEKYGSEE